MQPFARFRPVRRAAPIVLAALLFSGAASAQDALAGHPLYGRLGEQDRAIADLMVQETLESRLSQETRRWSNVRTGTAGYVTPLRTFKIRTGHFCRQYRETVGVGESLDTAVFTACRTEQGLWERVR